MLKLSIMSEEELTHIFGNLDAYIPLHEDLLAQLSKATGADGTVGQIGQIVVNWVRVKNSTVFLGKSASELLYCMSDQKILYHTSDSLMVAKLNYL